MPIFQLPPAVHMLLARLQSCGHAAYAVGGCVRDSLLGRAVHDWDITTSATPEQMMRALDGLRLIETGLQHGTLTVYVDGENYEVTSFRADGAYEDHRRPKSVQFVSRLDDDLARRDFSVNAMAIDRAGHLHDPFGGESDLHARQIRCVGDPMRRFDEDALRILRGLRFAAVLGFSIHEDTAAAARALSHTLAHISAERTFAELSKTLLGDYVEAVLRQFAPIFGLILPPIARPAGWLPLSRALPFAPKSLAVRLALCCFLLCIPPRETLAALRADRRTIDDAAIVAAQLDRPVPANAPQTLRALNALGPERFFLWLDGARALAHARCDDAALESLACAQFRANGLLSGGTCFRLDQLALRGNDLLALGIAPGKPLGQMLLLLLDEVICGNLPNNRAKLTEFVYKTNK